MTAVRPKPSVRPCQRLLSEGCVEVQARGMDACRATGTLTETQRLQRRALSEHAATCALPSALQRLVGLRHHLGRLELRLVHRCWWRLWRSLHSWGRGGRRGGCPPDAEGKAKGKLCTIEAIVRIEASRTRVYCSRIVARARARQIGIPTTRYRK